MHRIAWKVDIRIGKVWGLVHRTDDANTSYCGARVPEEFTDEVGGLVACSKCEHIHAAQQGVAEPRPKSRSAITHDQVGDAIAKFQEGGGIIRRLPAAGDGMDLRRVNTRVGG